MACRVCKYIVFGYFNTHKLSVSVALGLCLAFPVLYGNYCVFQKLCNVAYPHCTSCVKSPSDSRSL